eukprot:2727296-Alexandrium_andersonii.AAC.1
MSASLVGSEMCIRDSIPAPSTRSAMPRAAKLGLPLGLWLANGANAFLPFAGVEEPTGVAARTASRPERRRMYGGSNANVA